MKRIIVYTKKFNKDLKRVNNYKGFDFNLLYGLINQLASGKRLGPRYKDHKMLNTKLYNNSNNFHLNPDILVLYKIETDTIKLLRIGNHSNILGNEKNNRHYV